MSVWARVIVAGFVVLAVLAVLTCYAMCVASGRAAQYEEDHFGIRRS